MPRAYPEFEPIRDRLVTLQFGSVVQTNAYGLFSIFSTYQIENLNTVFVKAAPIIYFNSPDEHLQPNRTFSVSNIRAYVENWDFDRMQRAYLLPYLEEQHEELAQG